MPAVESEWWREHFSGLMTDLWRSLLPPGQSAADVAFVEKACRGRLSAGSRILDVPCGEGRVALELAKRGYRVTGVDISSDLMAHARLQSASAGLDIEWREGDMRDLPWEAEFDAVCCLGDSFGYMDDAGNGEFLRAVRRVLRPSTGTLLMEIKMAAEVLFPSYRESASGTVGSIALEVRRHFEPRTGRLEVTYHLRRGAEVATRTASYRIYTCAQIVTLLEQAGFTEVRLEDASGADFRLGSERLRVVAK